MEMPRTAFSGKSFSSAEMKLIHEVVNRCGGLSRMELAHTVCGLLAWARPGGGLKARECREFLEALEAQGVLRLWASVQKDPEEVLEEAFREALRRDPKGRKNWVGLVDGNQTRLDLLKKLSRKHEVKLTVVLDLMHVSEYLWSASVAFHDEASPQREQWVGERLHKVLLGKAAHVAAGMRRSATLRALSGAQRKPLDVAAGYLLNHTQYMRYQEYLAAGLPIATGVIEGACRHLVCGRMDRAARWSLTGAAAVLRLRALRSSGDFNAYWDYQVAQEYQRNHVARYANGNVAPVKGSMPALRLVK